MSHELHEYLRHDSRRPTLAERTSQVVSRCRLAGVGVHFHVRLAANLSFDSHNQFTNAILYVPDPAALVPVTIAGPIVVWRRRPIAQQSG